MHLCQLMHMQVYLWQCECMRSRVELRSAQNGHMKCQRRVQTFTYRAEACGREEEKKEEGEPERICAQFVSNLCDISGPLRGGCQVQCNHFYDTHSPHSLPCLATCPFYIQRSIIQCAAAPCNAATLATTCHCLLHNCRHLASINYSLPRLTRCLIRKRM